MSSPLCRRPSLVTRLSRWSWFCPTCRSPFWAQFSLCCYFSAVASCWPACSTTPSWDSTSDLTSGRSSGLWCCSLKEPHELRMKLKCWCNTSFLPCRYFVKLSCVEEKLPPHYLISQPTLRLVEQIQTLLRWSHTSTHAPTPEKRTVTACAFTEVWVIKLHCCLNELSSKLLLIQTNTNQPGRNNSTRPLCKKNCTCNSGLLVVLCRNLLQVLWALP